MKIFKIIVFPLFIILFFYSCSDKNDKLILTADREAPLGWIYLNLYDDNSFEFVSKGLRDKKIYSGNYKIKEDTIYFKYKDSIPTAGNIAVLENGYIRYINGKYHEFVEIKINKLKK